MVASKWPLPVDVQCSQLHFIVQQSFGVVAIGKINSDNLFILRIQVVQTPGKRMDVIMWKIEGNMVYLSIMAIAVGLFIRFLAVSIVRRLLPSLLIDSIWGEGSMKEAANDSSWIFHWIAGGFQSFWKLTITAVVENSNFGCCTKSQSLFLRHLNFPTPQNCFLDKEYTFPATESSKSIHIYSDCIHSYQKGIHLNILTIYRNVLTLRKQWVHFRRAITSLFLLFTFWPFHHTF